MVARNGSAITEVSRHPAMPMRIQILWSTKNSATSVGDHTGEIGGNNRANPDMQVPYSRIMIVPHHAPMRCSLSSTAATLPSQTRCFFVKIVKTASR